MTLNLTRRDHDTIVLIIVLLIFENVFYLGKSASSCVVFHLKLLHLYDFQVCKYQLTSLYPIPIYTCYMVCLRCGMLEMWYAKEVAYWACGMLGMCGFHGCGILTTWDVRDVGFWERGMFEMWDVWDVECSGCGKLGMWDVRDVGFSGCEMLGMWDLQDVGFWGCGMFGMWNVQDVGCSGCGMFRMCNVGCLPQCEMLIYKMPLKKLIFNAIIKSQVSYCPLVWMVCFRQTSNMINKLYKRAL